MMLSGGAAGFGELGCIASVAVIDAFALVFSPDSTAPRAKAETIEGDKGGSRIAGHRISLAGSRAYDAGGLYRRPA
jgi:hypothetical protein